MEPKDQKEAELFSLWATSGVFGWQRLHDDGLWLDDGTAKNIEEIRHLQQHQWIKDPWDTDEERVSEIKLPVVDWERIFAWCKGLE